MNRRRFLSDSTTALSAMALRGADKREVRAAVAGIGVRGAELLAQALELDGVRITAICDIDAQARDRGLSMAKRDNPKAFAEFRQVIDLKDVEAVLVATPCDLHAEMAATCLDAGKHVYCEKPLGVTPEQVDLALRAARRSTAFLQIGQQLRYYPGLREAIRQIQDEKVIGRPFVIKAQRHGTPSMPGRERKRPAWYLDVKRSGDLIVENAVHNLDACNWVAASRPAAAFGQGKKYLPQPVPAGSAMMDGFSVEYVYENEMHLDYSQLYLHPRGLKELANGQWYLILGEKGTVNLTQGLLYEMHESQPREIVPAAIRDGRENALEDFFSCIRENRKPFADVRVAATAALTAIMGRESIYRRRMVTWKELGVAVEEG